MVYQHVISTAKNTVSRITVKPLLSRKTWLLDSYATIMNQHKMVLFAHYNNLLQAEDSLMRNNISKIGGKIIYLRTGLFKIWCQNSLKSDICAPIKENDKIHRSHPLLPLLAGPTAMVAFPMAEPKKLGQAIRQLKKGNSSLILLGGLVESQVMNVDQLAEFSKLHDKSQLQEQLVNLLERNSRDLLNVLTHESTHLVNVLQNIER